MILESVVNGQLVNLRKKYSSYEYTSKAHITNI